LLQEFLGSPDHGTGVDFEELEKNVGWTRPRNLETQEKPGKVKDHQEQNHMRMILKNKSTHSLDSQFLDNDVSLSSHSREHGFTKST